MASRSIPKVVRDIIIIAIAVIAVWVGMQVIFGVQSPFYVVSSGSMIPELQVFDVLVVNGNEPFEDVQVGDIIVFNRPSGQDRVIVHRVASIIDENPLIIRTKGDANPASIPGTDFPITQKEYIGQVIYVIPQVGYITRILAPPINYIIIAIIIGVMILRHIAKRSSELKEKDVHELNATNKDINKIHTKSDYTHNESGKNSKEMPDEKTKQTDTDQKSD